MMIRMKYYFKTFKELNDKGFVYTIYGNDLIILQNRVGGYISVDFNKWDEGKFLNHEEFQVFRELFI